MLIMKWPSETHFISQIFGILWKFTWLFFFALRWWATLCGEQESSTRFFWTDYLVVGKFLGLMEHDEQQRSWAYYSEQARSRWVRVSKVGKVSFVSSSHSAAIMWKSKFPMQQQVLLAEDWRSISSSRPERTKEERLVALVHFPPLTMWTGDVVD